MFIDKYKLTKAATVDEPYFRRLAKQPPWSEINAGSYNFGLISIIDNKFDQRFLGSWDWLIGKSYLLIAVLWDGSFIYACGKEKAFFIVLSDTYKKYSMGNSLSGVFNGNIASHDFEEKILKVNLFDKYRNEAGDLDYGEIYVYRNSEGKVIKQDISLYLDISGQTGRQIMSDN